MRLSKKNCFFNLTASLFVIVLSSVSFAQGSIRGVVLDSTNSEPLIGANIIVEGTSLGTATDLDGKFRITGIPLDSKSIKISYLGYHSNTLQLDLTKKEEYLSIKLSLAILALFIVPLK